MSEWKVFFDTNFWGSYSKTDPAYEAAFDVEQPMLTVEHRIDRIVDWCGETWRLLSLYSCEKGLVIDYCKETDPAELTAFVQKFREADLENDFDEEVFERLQLENPTVPNAYLKLHRGACELQSLGSSGIHYNPLPIDGEELKNDPLALACIEHYRLNQGVAYSFSRAHFLWDEDHTEDLSGLTCTFSEPEVTVPGEHFTLSGEAQDVLLVHPVTGKKYTLHIDHIEEGELPGENPEQMGDDMIYPTHFETVYYDIDPPCENADASDPDSPGQNSDDPCIVLHACVKGDPPVPKRGSKKAAAAVSVIGGASGPTSVFVMGRARSEIHLKSICSPLFFEPVQVREWRVNYRIRRREDLTAALYTVQ